MALAPIKGPWRANFQAAAGSSQLLTPQLAGCNYYKFNAKRLTPVVNPRDTRVLDLLVYRAPDDSRGNRGVNVIKNKELALLLRVSND